MYGLLSKATDRIEGSLNVLEQEERAGRDGKGGVNFLAQQMYQLSIAYSALRKEERDAAKSPLASDNLNQEEMMSMLIDTFTEDELQHMLDLKKGAAACDDTQEETNGTGE
jgi:hypothetical protein